MPQAETLTHFRYKNVNLQCLRGIEFISKNLGCTQREELLK